MKTIRLLPLSYLHLIGAMLVAVPHYYHQVSGATLFTNLELGDFSENGLDRRLVEDCFRRQHFRSKEKDNKDEKYLDKNDHLKSPAHHCRQFVREDFGSSSSSTAAHFPTIRHLSRQHYYRQLIEQDERDRQRVIDCLLNATLASHATAAPTSQCYGLTWGPLVNEAESEVVEYDSGHRVMYSLRQSRIALHLRHAREDITIAQSCLYDRWQADRGHLCYQLIGIAGAHSSVSTTKSPSSSPAPSSSSSSNLFITQRKQNQKELYRRLLEQDHRDRHLVRHCVLYHQFDLYEPCRGITWPVTTSGKAKVKVFSQRRQARLEALVAEMKQSLLSLNADDEADQQQHQFSDNPPHSHHQQRLIVHSCLYSSAWVTVSGHHCHRIVRGELDSTDSLPGEQTARLHTLFTELKMKNLVTDCFDHHQTDHLPACYGISWGLVVGAAGDKGAQKEDHLFTPYLEAHRQIWQQLLRLAKCE
ncbi:hypothetical protein TYRP_015979 [Tyrophagus putrescentiae]|nr:hypothetical protein TYRP_015979 [Tyrophagus putrescentiae]